MYAFLDNLDRRWIFLLMALAVGLPILLELQFPEQPTGLHRRRCPPLVMLQHHGATGA